MRNIRGLAGAKEWVGILSIKYLCIKFSKKS